MHTKYYNNPRLENMTIKRVRVIFSIDDEYANQDL